MPDYEILTKMAVDAAIAGGEEVMEVYNMIDINVTYKEDKSPLTEADIRSNEIIKNYLGKSELPILSEEERNISYDERKNWDVFWLVDPLDGTREFVKRNGEFTVNIALIKNNAPIIGVIYVPVSGNIYFSSSFSGSYRISHVTSDFIKSKDLKSLINIASSLPLSKNRNKIIGIGSRSHLSLKTKIFFHKLKRKYENLDIIKIGSSLKLCLIAEGNADIYPRFSPTMEWDIAAGHALIENAGFKIYEYKSNNPILYNKENLKNPYFVAGNTRII